MQTWDHASIFQKGNVYKQTNNQTNSKVYSRQFPHSRVLTRILLENIFKRAWVLFHLPSSVPLVWSWSGPVPSLPVLPWWRLQSNSSVVSCSQSPWHSSSSKLHMEYPAVTAKIENIETCENWSEDERVKQISIKHMHRHILNWLKTAIINDRAC